MVNTAHLLDALAPQLSQFGLTITAGGILGGVLGAVVAIPLSAVLQVFMRRVVAPAFRQRTSAKAPGGSMET